VYAGEQKILFEGRNFHCQTHKEWQCGSPLAWAMSFSECMAWASGPDSVFRYRPAGGASPWFFEAGVGLTLTTSLYETDRKRFSTTFNFGDHLAVGRNFGQHSEHELSLRLRHFSNGVSASQ
jgi:Lipid A 3-O-deacylase (PagL)